MRKFLLFMAFKYAYASALFYDTPQLRQSCFR